MTGQLYTVQTQRQINITKTAASEQHRTKNYTKSEKISFLKLIKSKIYWL